MLKWQLSHRWKRGKNEPMAGGLRENDRTEGIRTSYFFSDVGVKVKEEIQ